MMKKMNKKSIMAIVFAAMFVFASVAGIFLPQQASAVGKRGKIRTIKVTSVKKLTVGKRSRIKVKVAPKKVAAKVTYKSSNKTIATVNRKGVVKAKRPGRVTITVKAKSKNTKTKRIRIKVIPKKTSTKKKTSKKKKKQTTSKNTTKKDDTSSGNNGSNNSGKNDNDGEDVTPSYETALDKKTSADGILNVSYSDMESRKVAGKVRYYIPYDFTKAKVVNLPEGNYYVPHDDDIKNGITYIFNGQSHLIMQVRYSSNQDVINNLEYDQPGTETVSGGQGIVGNGTAQVTTYNNKKITIVVQGYNSINTLRYQCKKVVSEITDNSMTDMKKVNTILDYIVDHRDSHYTLNIGIYHVVTDCTGYSAIIAQMLNFAGVDCCVRLAGYDKYYGQTPTHQNNLACIDGVAYVIDEDIMMKYSDLFDSNNCHIGYNTYYASQYPELNREGKLDYNLTRESAPEYKLVLKKAGRL